MSDTGESLSADFDSLSLSPDFELPRQRFYGNHAASIAAPSYESFTSRFGRAFPKPRFVESDFGTIAVYDLPPPSEHSKRPVLIIHGLNTPALGMWPLAKELQSLDPDAHVVLFDLWGHGLSSTPLVAHTQQIFFIQIYQVLSFMRWPSAHIVGYSFGALAAMRFAVQNRWTASPVALLGPAGLLRMEDFSPEMQELLHDSKGRAAEARNSVLEWLEGGPLVVPKDCQERVNNGEVVAEALREWELQEHSG